MASVFGPRGCDPLLMPSRSRIARAQGDWDAPQFQQVTINSSVTQLVGADPNRAVLIISLRAVGVVQAYVHPLPDPLQFANPGFFFAAVAGAGAVALATLNQSYQANGNLVNSAWWGIIQGAGSALANITTWRYKG